MLPASKEVVFSRVLHETFAGYQNCLVRNLSVRPLKSVDVKWATWDQTWVHSIFCIRFNSVSESLDSTQPMTHNGFTGIDSNRLKTQETFQNFDSNRLMTKKNSGILIRIKSRLNDSNQLLISLTFLSFQSISLPFLGFH